MKRLWMVLIALLFVLPVVAQDLETTVTLERRNDSFAFTLAVLNTSPNETIGSVTVQLTGNTFDTHDGSGIPDLGINNDGIKSDVVIWSTALGQNDLLEIRGDIDGNADPAQIEVTLDFDSGLARTFLLAQQPNPLFWQGILSESLGSLNPIINGTATATIRWVNPTQRTDDTPLDNLAGSVIYWDQRARAGRCSAGPSSRIDTSCYANLLDIPNGNTVTEAFVLNLNEDTTLYFAMIAYDAENLLSDYSNEIAKSFVLVITMLKAPPESPTLNSVDIVFTCTTDQAGVTCEFREVVP